MIDSPILLASEAAYIDLCQTPAPKSGFFDTKGVVALANGKLEWFVALDRPARAMGVVTLLMSAQN